MRQHRTDHARLIRHLYGDKGGGVKFSDKVYLIDRSGIAGAITTLAKDNLILIERDL